MIPAYLLRITWRLFADLEKSIILCLFYTGGGGEEALPMKAYWYGETRPKGYLRQASGVWKGRDFTRWSIWKGREICHLGLWKGPKG